MQTRPSWDQYFLSLAHAAAARSNCRRRNFGAVLVKQNRLVSSGYNGTPSGITNCFDGGCGRCASDVPAWEEYDACICVHAEINAILLASQRSDREGATLYTQQRPCLSCLKELIPAGVQEIVFETDFRYPDDREIDYQRLVAESGVLLRLISLHSA